MDDKMKFKRIISLLFLIFVISGAFVFAQSKNDQCFICHSQLGDTKAAQYKKDIHYLKGVSCAGCHGGNEKSDDMEKSMNKDAGFIGVPKGDKISEQCSNCHSSLDEMKKYGSLIKTDQFNKMKISSHGQMNIKGTERIAQCITCHNSHGIVSVKNPGSPVYPTNIVKTCTKCHSDKALMKQYNPAIPTSQKEDYYTSRHGIANQKGDIKTAHCASCHGSHDIFTAKDLRSHVYPTNLPEVCATCHSNTEYMKTYQLPTNQLEKYTKSVHGIALLKKGDTGSPSCNSCHGNHAATPPGIESISKVCGTCHVLNAGLFASSPHKQAFDKKRLPECETCHGHHEIITATDVLLGVSEGSLCRQCHGENPESIAFITAKTMRSFRDSLVHEEKSVLSSLTEAEQKGIEISDAKYKFRDARQALMESRTMVHSFDLAKYTEIIGKGLSVTTSVGEEVNNAVEEFYFRRWGFGVSTLIITVLAVSLFLYIRRIEQRKK